MPGERQTGSDRRLGRLLRGQATSYWQVLALTICFIALTFGAIYAIWRAFGWHLSWGLALFISAYGQSFNAWGMVRRLRRRRLAEITLSRSARR